jgi:hypothetical protein
MSDRRQTGKNNSVTYDIPIALRHGIGQCLVIEKTRASGFQGQEQTMTNHPRRTAVAAARKAAQTAGYYIREGSYSGTTDDRLGRWYVGHKDDDFFRPYGRGYATQGDAWIAIADELARG